MEHIMLLYQAAQEGNVTTFRKLVKEDNLILNRFNSNEFFETPLHVAAMLGHVDFVKEIIKHNPKLAIELDTRHLTPLHLAVANDHVETVRVLLSAINHDKLLGSAWDGEGRNPLHLAAERGRLDVLREMLRVAPKTVCWANLKGRSGTVLHVCVKHNQLEALKFLVSAVDDCQFVNAKDDYGMTVLHLAVANKQIETVKFLLTNTEIEVNAVNANKLTALDILAQSERSEKDFDILVSLHSARASPSPTIDRPLTTDDSSNNSSARRTHDHHHQKQNVQQEKAAEKKERWLLSERESLMVVASLIATMAFQAGLTPPGGLWQDTGDSPLKLQVSNNNDTNPATYRYWAGESIISYEKEKLYRIYLFFNTVGFVGSLSIILLLVTGLPFCRRFSVWILKVILWFTITAMTITYIIAVVVTGQDIWTSFSFFICVILAWGVAMLVVLIFHSIHVSKEFYKWLRKKIFPKMRSQQNSSDVESSM